MIFNELHQRKKEASEHIMSVNIKEYTVFKIIT